MAGDIGPAFFDQMVETVVVGVAIYGAVGFAVDDGDGIPEAHGWTVDLTASADGGARFEFTGVEFVD